MDAPSKGRTALTSSVLRPPYCHPTRMVDTAAGIGEHLGGDPGACENSAMVQWRLPAMRTGKPLPHGGSCTAANATPITPMALQGWAGWRLGHCGATQEDTGIGLETTLSDWLANIVAMSRKSGGCCGMMAPTG